MSICNAAAKRRAETIGAALFGSFKDAMNWLKSLAGVELPTLFGLVVECVMHTIRTFIAHVGPHC